MGLEEKYLYGVNEEGWSEKYGEDYLRPMTDEEKEILSQEAEEEAKVYSEPDETNPLRFRPKQPTQPGSESQPAPQPEQPASGQTPPPATSGVADPFANTRAAMSEQHKTWRQMLIDNHKKREAERKKRLRSAQIVGLGKALGDLLGAAFAGAGSIKGNYGAIIPQAQSPKSVEQIQKLINDGVITAKEYDNMMQNLAMQVGRDNIALAKSLDELGIQQRAAAARQAFEKDQADIAWMRKKQADKTMREWESDEKNKTRQHEKEMQESQQNFQKDMKRLDQAFQAAEAKKDRAARLAAARIAAARKPGGQNTGDKLILGAATPDGVEYKDNDLKLILYREYNNMIKAGFNPENENDKKWWAENYNDIQTFINDQGGTYAEVKKVMTY